MAQIIDKDTRLIDIDFGVISVGSGREIGSFSPTGITSGGNGLSQLLRLDEVGDARPGSFIQFQRIDLTYMTMNNEVMQPVDVSIQRTSPVPLGFNYNGNAFDQIEEYIYVFTRPLNNTEIATSPTAFEAFRDQGLDMSQLPFGIPAFAGRDAGIPDHVQTIYAEKRMYSYSTAIGATATNGQLIPLSTATAPTTNMTINEIYGMPVLDNVTTWGTMSTITGPNLYAYRIVINPTQTIAGGFGTGIFTNVDLSGSSSLRFPPVNISFLCKDPNFTEGEYLTRLANAMNSLPEDGLAND